MNFSEIKSSGYFLINKLLQVNIKSFNSKICVESLSPLQKHN